MTFGIFLARGSAAGAALKSGDAAVCGVPGAHLSRRTLPKSFTLLVFSRFWGSGAGKKEAKIIRCSILGRFEQLFDDFLLRSGSKNTVKYSVFPFRGENCGNISVFARHGHKNILNTMIFATRGQKKKRRKYRGFGLPRRKKHRYLPCFLLWECQKMRKHDLFDDFLGVHKNAED